MGEATLAAPKRGIVTRHRDPNTGERETWADCKQCGAPIEDWAGEWRHSFTDKRECEP